MDTPYPTKEWLQPKRYSAHLSGTTYIYDFPELFRQGVHMVRGPSAARYAPQATQNRCARLHRRIGADQFVRWQKRRVLVDSSGKSTLRSFPT